MAARAYTWNVQAQRYVGPDGRFVSRQVVIDGLDYALDSAKLRGRALSAQLRSGTITLVDWEQGMRQVVKEVHLYSAATARGGWAQMSYTDFGNMGPQLRYQYGKLANFAREIQSGYPLDGRFMQRTELYLLSGRSSFHLQDERVQREAGMTQERNQLASGDNCYGCVTETRRGWVAIGTLVPPGRRTCLGRCKCIVQYRKLDQ